MMRSSSPRAPLPFKPKEPPPAAAPEPEAPPRESTPVGTDLSLPVEIAGRLASALQAEKYKLEQANTAKNQTGNICFHRIVGRSETGTCSAALLYFDRARLENPESWFVYSLCIRICKHFGNGEPNTLGIAFLAPEGTPWPDTWTQHGEDIADLNIVRAVRFRTIAHPATWTTFDAQTAMQNVREWVGKLDLRPLAEMADTFGARREPAPQLSAQPSAASLQPAVFVSYSHDDQEWLDQILARIAPLSGQHCRLWTDRDIRSGADWSQTIEAALESSQIVILIVSESFLSSEYINNVELKRALDAADAGRKTVLWVYAKKAMRLPPELNRWQAAHDIDTPLERIDDQGRQKQQLFKIYDALEQCLKDLAGQRPRS